MSKLLALLLFSSCVGCYLAIQLPPSVFEKLKTIRSTQEFIDRMLNVNSSIRHQIEDSIFQTPVRPANRFPQFQPQAPPGLPGFPGPSRPNSASGFPNLGAPQGPMGMPERPTISVSETSKHNFVLGELDDFCEVKETSVPIPADIDPLVIHWPQCIRLPRCGGCCNYNQLHCTPTSTDFVNVQVLKARLNNDNGKFDYNEIVNLRFERHKSCDCRCKISSNDCNSKQTYDSGSCSCVCSNERLASTCPSNKRWDPNECRCVCSRRDECTAFEEFNEHHCRCRFKFQNILFRRNRSADDSNCSALKCPSGKKAVKTSDNQCVCRTPSVACATKVCRPGYIATPNRRNNGRCGCRRL